MNNVSFVSFVFVACFLFCGVFGEYEYPQTLLEWLLYPINVHDFISTYLYNKPLHLTRSNPDYYKIFELDKVYKRMLLNLDTISKYKDSNNPSGFPQVRALKYGNDIENELEPFRMDQNKIFLSQLNKTEIDIINRYHLSLNYNLGFWDIKSLKYAFHKNFTIRFYQTETHSNITKNLAQSFMDYLSGFYVRINIYITPPYNKAFGIHHDIEDIFILQIKGKKRWKIYQHSYKYCNLYEYEWKQHPETAKTFNLCQNNVISPWDSYDYKYKIGKYIDNDSNLSSEIMEFVLESGDLIYLPRGWMHEASMYDLNDYDGDSIHISVGMYLELYVDYLYNFVKYVFVKCKKCKSLLLEKYLMVKESNDIQDGIQYILENFEIFLRSVAFTNDDLRIALPYFYVCDLDKKMNENDLVILRMFGVYFKMFMEFIVSQNEVLFNRILMKNTNINGLMEILEQLVSNKNYKLFFKVKRRICMQYNSDYKKLNRIYVHRNKKLEKRYKRISLPMRFDEVRRQLSMSQTFK